MAASALIGAIACTPTADDIAKAKAAKDVERLKQIFAAHVPGLDAPALSALLSCGGQADWEPLLVAGTQPGGDAAVVDAALTAWPEKPEVLDVIWATTKTDPIQLAHVLEVARGRDANALAAFLESSAPKLKTEFADAALASRTLDSVIMAGLGGKATPAIRLAAHQARRRAVAVDQSETNAHRVNHIITSASLLQTDAAMPCAVAYELLFQIGIVEAIESAGQAAALLSWSAPLVCAEKRDEVVRAYLSGLDALAPRGDPFARTITEPAQGYCPDGPFSKSMCGDGWAETKPALSQFVDEKAPQEDAARLRRAGTRLRVAAEVGARKDLDTLAERAFGLAGAEEGARRLFEDVEEKVDALAAALDNRKDFTLLRGFIVASHDTRLFEVAVAGRSKHALLRTSDTVFTTRGSFRLWATKTGSETIKTVNGFSEEWDTYTEIVSDRPKELDAEIAQARAELKTAKAALAAATKKMASERAGLAKALAAVRL